MSGNSSMKKDQAQDHLEKGRQSASSGIDRMKDAASQVGQAASSAASTIGQKASDMASTVGNKAEDATAAVGRGMESLGHKVRDRAPDSGMLGSAAGAVAGALENSGRYLEDKNLSGMGEDLTNLIRRNPIPALFVGIGVGFLLSKMLRS